LPFYGAAKPVDIRSGEAAAANSVGSSIMPCTFGGMQFSSLL
jgi:hypothetical protein